MNWFGKMLVRLGATPPPDDDFWYEDAGVRSSLTGIYVGPVTSMQSVGVNTCVNVLAQTVASLPCSPIERYDAGGGREGKRPARDHELYDLVHNAPNEEQTSFEFWEMAMVHLCTWGNSYSRLEMAGPKKIVQAIHPLSPSCVQVKRDPDTRVRYYEWREPGWGKPEILLDDEILHIPANSGDGLKGYSPVEMMRRSIEMSNAAEEYGARFFKNNAMPRAYISIPVGVGDKAKENMLNWFISKFGGLKNSHKFGVLDNGAKIETVPINHRDLQFLELRKFQLEEIARIYRVPLHLIQSLDRATFSNIEHQSIDFAVHTIGPWLKRIEDRLNKALLGPKERSRFYFKFNLSALLRGDSAARAKYYTQLRNSGIITANEIREFEDMNPVDGGDELLIQGAMVPVSQAGQFQQQKAAAKAAYRMMAKLAHPDRAIDGEDREQRERAMVEANLAYASCDAEKLRRMCREWVFEHNCSQALEEAA